jgi:hypothetical protein
MAAITIPNVMLRTTIDGTGYKLGVAAGSGPTAPLALAALNREATTMAQAAADPLDDAAVSYIQDGTWGLEVIDLRLTHGPGPREDDGWLAYGTLRTTGLSPFIPADEPMPRA